MTSPSVVVSNGYDKFILSAAAAELARLGWLERLLTGWYPSHLTAAMTRTPVVRRSRPVRQSLNRREEGLPDHLVCSYGRHEAAGRLVGMAPGMDLYANATARWLDRYQPSARIFHVRAGYGGQAIGVAREAGMTVVCDQSLVHPQLLAPMLEATGAGTVEPLPVDSLGDADRRIVADIDAADIVLVNSDFVARGLEQLGHETSRVKVIPQGIDRAFVRGAPEPGYASRSRQGPIHLVVPAFTRRKGADVLVEALRKMAIEWRLTITKVPEQASASAHAAFLADSRVQVVNPVRADLPAVWAKADLFVLPSLAEGSARVVFEAMFLGCAVIATDSSGTVIDNGRTGVIVPRANPVQLRAAIEQLALSPDTMQVLGQAARAYIQQHFTAIDYGRNLIGLYNSI